MNGARGALASLHYVHTRRSKAEASKTKTTKDKGRTIALMPLQWDSGGNQSRVDSQNNNRAYQKISLKLRECHRTSGKGRKRGGMGHTSWAASNTGKTFDKADTHQGQVPE